MADDDRLVAINTRRQDLIEDEHPARFGFGFLPADRLGQLLALGLLETELADLTIRQQQVLLLPADQANFSAGPGHFAGIAHDLRR